MEDRMVCWFLDISVGTWQHRPTALSSPSILIGRSVYYFRRCSSYPPLLLIGGHRLTQHARPGVQLPCRCEPWPTLDSGLRVGILIQRKFRYPIQLPLFPFGLDEPGIMEPMCPSFGDMHDALFDLARSLKVIANLGSLAIRFRWPLSDGGPSNLTMFGSLQALLTKSSHLSRMAAHCSPVMAIYSLPLVELRVSTWIGQALMLDFSRDVFIAPQSPIPGQISEVK